MAAMSNINIEAFFDDASNTASYVISDPTTGAAAIIDPVLDYDPATGRTSTSSADTMLAFVDRNGLSVGWILETHIHADHLSAAQHLKSVTAAKIATGAQISTVQERFAGLFDLQQCAADGAEFDVLFEDGDEFTVGTLPVRVIATPGHTPSCISYVVADAAFVGDTLFMPDFGTARTDFPGGSAKQLYHSIHKILALGDNVRLFLCHDYKAPGRDTFAWETTVRQQRQENIHINDAVDENEFVARREARDKQLAMPKLIIPSLQVNMVAGQLPASNENGIRYLKIPLDML